MSGLQATRETADRLGVETVDGKITDSEGEMKVLQDAWAKTFATEKELDMEEAEVFLEDYQSSVQWNWAACQFPTSDTMEAYFALLQNSAPGKDGIPNAVWKIFRSHAAVIRHFMMLLFAFLQGLAIPPGFNDGLNIINT